MGSEALIHELIPSAHAHGGGRALALHRIERLASEVTISIHALSLAALFEEAARALAEVIGTADRVIPPLEHRTRLAATSRDELLIAWLDEIGAEHARSGRVFAETRILRIGETELEGIAYGYTARELHSSVKRATLRGVRVRSGSYGFSVTVALEP